MNSHGLDGFNQDIRKCEGSYSIRDRIVACYPGLALLVTQLEL